MESCIRIIISCFSDKKLVIKIFLLLFLSLSGYAISTEDYNFQFLKTPYGDKKTIGFLNYYGHSKTFVLTQNDTSKYFKLYFSTDDTKNWVMRNSKGEFNKESYIFIRRDNRIYAGWQKNIVPDLIDSNSKWLADGLLKSTDGGYNWKFSHPTPSYDNKNVKLIETGTDNECFLNMDTECRSGMPDYPLWVSESSPFLDLIYDKFRNWTLCVRKGDGLIGFNRILQFGDVIGQLSNIPDELFEKMALDEYGNLIGFSNVKEETSGIYYSENGGYYCWLIRKLLAGEAILSINTYKNAIIVGTNNGMQVSYNKGEIWQDIQLPAINKFDKSVRLITINNETGDIYAVYSDSYLIKGKIIITGINARNPDFTNIFSIFPNPAMDYITIKEVEGGHPLGFSIYNSFGQLLIESKKGDCDNNLINISAMPSGLYYVRIGDEFQNFIKY
jgi:hypothetical protein